MSKILAVKLICALSFNDLDIKENELLLKEYQPYENVFEKTGDENSSANGIDLFSRIYKCQRMVKYDQYK